MPPPPTMIAATIANGMKSRIDLRAAKENDGVFRFARLSSLSLFAFDMLKHPSVQIPDDSFIMDCGIEAFSPQLELE